MRRGAWASVLAVLALAVAGCSEPEQPNTSLPTAASTSAEPTLEPLGPADLQMPDAARSETPEGASSFVNYYVELINRAQSDYNVEYLDQFAADCSTCQTLIDGFSAFADAGYTVTGGQISIDSLEPSAVDGDEVQFVASLSQQAVEVADSAGSPQTDLSAAAASFPGSGGVVRWVPESDSWQLLQLTIS